MDSSSDTARLRACISDLVGLLGLRALWIGRDPGEIVGILLDALLRMLQLDVAYARLSDSLGGHGIEQARHAKGAPPAGGSATAIGRELAPWLRPGAPAFRREIPQVAGGGELSIAQLWIGLDADTGVVAVGSRRLDFPNEIESLLLRVAVNQAALELQGLQVTAARDHAVGMERLKDQLQEENLYLRRELDTVPGFDEVVGTSGSLRAVFRLVEQVASTDACVLIQGETGTGKELVARAVHRASPRRGARLREGELRGDPRRADRERAVRTREGRVHRRDRPSGSAASSSPTAARSSSTRWASCPSELQAKLLRVLEEQEFERLGSIAHDPRRRAHRRGDEPRPGADGRRRPVPQRPVLPPEGLPDRRAAAARAARGHPAPRAQLRRSLQPALQQACPSIGSEAMTALCRYAWPGNVRELENFIERCVILSQASSLEVPLGELETRRDAPPEDALVLEDVERQHILRVLGDSNWVIAGPTGAAAKLGMKRTSLQYRMRKLGIARSSA